MGFSFNTEEERGKERYIGMIGMLNVGGNNRNKKVNLF
jgi:hypothetical protein